MVQPGALNKLALMCTLLNLCLVMISDGVELVGATAHALLAAHAVLAVGVVPADVLSRS